MANIRPTNKLPKAKHSFLGAFFDVTKKIVDILDDVWALTRGIIPSSLFNLIAPFLSGGVGIIIHLVEGIRGMKDAYRTYLNKKHGQRKTRIATGLSIALLGATGTIMGIVLIAGSIGAFISLGTIQLLSILIPAFLTTIYALELGKQSYILKEAIKQESDNPSNVTYREKRLKVERTVAFGVIEVTASAIVLIGSILGMSLLLGISAATFGIAPIALLGVGVGLGLLCKLGDFLDRKQNYAYTAAMRQSITHCFARSSSATILEKTATLPHNPKHHNVTEDPTTPVNISVMTIEETSTVSDDFSESPQPNHTVAPSR